MLDHTNSQSYRSRAGASKLAHLHWQGADYLLTWGMQTFAGPHMQVVAPDGPYGVELATFFATHEAVPEAEHHYVKVERVRAACSVAPFTLVTLLAGRVEMVAEVPAGAFVVQNPQGELYAMSAEQFWLRYEPAPGGE